MKGKQNDMTTEIPSMWGWPQTTERKEYANYSNSVYIFYWHWSSFIFPRLFNLTNEIIKCVQYILESRLEYSKIPRRRHIDCVTIAEPAAMPKQKHNKRIGARFSLSIFNAFPTEFGEPVQAAIVVSLSIRRRNDAIMCAPWNTVTTYRVSASASASALVVDSWTIHIWLWFGPTLTRLR